MSGRVDRILEVGVSVTSILFQSAFVGWVGFEIHNKMKITQMLRIDFERERLREQQKQKNANE